MDGGTVILAPRSIASRANMNKVLLRRDDENMVNALTGSTACQSIVVKIKRKNANNIDIKKCDVLKRTALSNLNVANQACVHSNDKPESNSNGAKLMIKSSVSNRYHQQTHVNATVGIVGQFTPSFRNIKRPSDEREVEEYDGSMDFSLAMTTELNVDVKLFQRATQVSISQQQQQQQQQKNNSLELKAVLPMPQRYIETLKVTQIRPHSICMHTLNETCHRSVDIPKGCPGGNTTTTDVNVLPSDSTSKNEHKAPLEDLNTLLQPSENVLSAESSHIGAFAHEIVRIIDYDAENAQDPCQVSDYAADIFNYFKEREKQFKIGNYMPHQASINAWMRAALIDWMVIVQENFALNLETLYLAVKLVDIILNKSSIKKENLQLLGATAILLAAKFEETTAPTADDLVYISDNAFTRTDLLRSERPILRAVNYNLCIPLSYQFIRRYARCARIPMYVLTLARYILEISLMNYTLISASESKMAAASLFMALRMTNQNGWNGTLAFYSGYEYDDFAAIIPSINVFLHEERFNKGHQTIRKKYSQNEFFKVAQIPLMTTKRIIENADSSTTPT